MRLSAAHSSSPAAVTRARARSGVRPTISRTKPPRARPSSAGPSLLVALPERQLAGLTGGRGDEDTVVGDVLDAPRRRAEGEDVTDAGLVDHLLVELADPATGPFPGGEEHGIQPPVGDGAAARHREALGTPAARERVGDAVPDDARAQLGELVGGVAAGEHVERRLEDRARQRGEARRPVDERLDVGDGPVVHGAHGDDLLGEHVDGVGRDAQRLDGAGAHALDDDGGLHEVAAELREHDALAHGADLVARAADALQAARHRRRALDLDDEVDGAHVDAELEAARRDDGGQPTGLEVLLDGGAVLLADRAVVGAGEHRGRAAGGAGLGHDLRRRLRRERREARDGQALLLGEPLLPDLVEAGGQPLGEAARVGEDERRPVLGDEVDDALLDVRPDARLRSVGPRPVPTGRARPARSRPPTPTARPCRGRARRRRAPTASSTSAGRSRRAAHRRGSAPPPRRDARSPRARPAGPAWAAGRRAARG